MLVPNKFVFIEKKGTTTIDRKSNQEITKPMVMVTKVLLYVLNTQRPV